MDWQPAATLQILRQRAALLAQIRSFFSAQQILEVETPVLSGATNTDPRIESFTTPFSGTTPGRLLYLQTSPEFPMKRLLAAGSGPIYQICKVFRQGESGHYHNPEFTLLEWYRPGFNHHQLMEEVEQLTRLLLTEHLELGESRYLSYQQAFEQYAGLDPHQADNEQLISCAEQHGVTGVTGLTGEDRDGWLDLLMSHIIQPQLGQHRLTFIFDYPASQAALARISPDNPSVAERFELFLHGVELANGFHELADAVEQRHRFHQELQQRVHAGQPATPVDKNLLAALAHGLPDCAGVALGLDRLLMLAAGVPDICKVLSFPVERA